MAVRGRRLGGVGVALLLMLAVMVQPATASAERARAGEATEAVGAAPFCPAGTLCAWTGTDFTGRMIMIDPSTIGDCWGVTEGEVIRSVWNASSSLVLAWESPFCWGRNIPVSPGTGGTTRFPVQSFS